MIQPGIIAAQSGGARPTVVREYYAGEGLGLVASSNTTFQNAATLSIEPTAGDYLLVWSCDLQVSITTFNVAVGRLSAGGVEVARAAAGAALSDDTSGWSTQGGFARWTSDGSAVSLTLDVAVGNNTFVATGRIRNARVIALKLATSDESAESLAAQASDLTSYADACTLAFTPAEAGDYLVLGYAEVSGTVGDDGYVRLYDGTDGTTEYRIRFANGERVTAVVPWVKRGLSASQTLRLQYKASGSSNDVTMRGARVVALRLDGFSHAYIAELSANSTGTQTSYTTALDLARNLQDRDYLMLATWGMQGSSNTDLTNSRIVDDAVTVAETAMHPRVGQANTHFAARLAAWTVGRRSFQIQRQAPGLGDTATIAEPSLIALLQLN